MVPGTTLKVGDRVRHEGRRATVVGYEPAFRERAVMGDPGFVPGLADPTIEYEDGGKITVPADELIC
jgi:hypothetical protein